MWMCGEDGAWLGPEGDCVGCSTSGLLRDIGGRGRGGSVVRLRVVGVEEPVEGGLVHRHARIMKLSSPRSLRADCCQRNVRTIGAHPHLRVANEIVEDDQLFQLESKALHQLACPSEIVLVLAVLIIAIVVVFFSLGSAAHPSH